jgi:ribonuclease Z
MLATLHAGRYTIRGLSLGGVYTTLHVPELDLLFDVGLAPRSLGGVRTLCLSHAHADHVGALVTLLGHRALAGQRSPLRVIMPAEIVDDLTAALAIMTKLQRWPLDIEPIGLRPGDAFALGADLTLVAAKAFHPVPCLAYRVVRRVSKLKAEHLGKPGPEIARLKHAGADLFDVEHRSELAYATDTLATVLDHAPELASSHVLILECTFLDDRKPVAVARAGCHIHLDELIARAAQLTCEHLVLMHVSGVHRPRDVRGILDARLPPALRARTQALLPDGDWPG